MMYSEGELKNVLKQWLESDDHRLLARDLSKAWGHEEHGPRRYAKLFEDDNLTLWLLGWRPGIDTIDHHIDATPIHGHGASSALVTCLEGEVDNVDFGRIDQSMAIGKTQDTTFIRSVLKSGHSVYVPKDGVHIMECNEADHRGFAMTLHLYSPRLTTMTYYEQVSEKRGGAMPGATLRLVDTWTDTQPDTLIPEDLQTA